MLNTKGTFKNLKTMTEATQETAKMTLATKSRKKKNPAISEATWTLMQQRAGAKSRLSKEQWKEMDKQVKEEIREGAELFGSPKLEFNMKLNSKLNPSSTNSKLVQP